MADLKNLEEKIGYTFTDQTYLQRAVTHSSYANETGEKNHHLHCYERLEFLGDAVLSILTSEYLYRRFPNAALIKVILSRNRALVTKNALMGTTEMRNKNRDIAMLHQRFTPKSLSASAAAACSA